MNFAFSPEQDEFRDVLRRFVQEYWSIAEVRRLAGTWTDTEAATWQRMVDEIGLQGLAIPERYGGQGFGMLELGIALEELGRELAGGPFLASSLAAQVLLDLASPAEREELLPAIASGSCVASLAIAEGSGPPEAAGVRCLAQGGGPELRLHGHKPWVLGAPNADLLLVAVRAPGSEGTDGISLAAVRSDAQGVRVAPAAGLDLTRRYGHVSLEGASARALGEPGCAGAVLPRITARAGIALSAEQVGGAARCLESAVAYTRERIQFGRPVGSFQAVKHRAADVMAILELARSAAYWSWWVAASDGPELLEAGHLVKSLCSEAYRKAAYENIHLHGGMGFTWEHDAHLYHRRAQATEMLFGDPLHHRAALARHLDVLS
jgi:alkylation response protein AidB-like acyl-CoA dehydrogenase